MFVCARSIEKAAWDDRCEFRHAGDEGGEQANDEGEESDYPRAVPLPNLPAAFNRRHRTAAVTATVWHQRCKCTHTHVHKGTHTQPCFKLCVKYGPYKVSQGQINQGSSINSFIFINCFILGMVAVDTELIPGALVTIHPGWDISRQTIQSYFFCRLFLICIFDTSVKSELVNWFNVTQ